MTSEGHRGSQFSQRQLPSLYVSVQKLFYKESHLRDSTLSVSNHGCAHVGLQTTRVPMYRFITLTRALMKRDYYNGYQRLLR